MAGGSTIANMAMASMAIAIADSHYNSTAINFSCLCQTTVES